MHPWETGTIGLCGTSPPILRIKEDHVPSEAVQGKNGWGRNDYGGPCPPDREHRYFFKLYALDTVLPLKEGSTKGELERAMREHILEQTELIGLYEQT